MEEAHDIFVNIMDDRTHISLQRIGLQELGPWWNKERRHDPYWRLYANDKPGSHVVHDGAVIGIDPATAVLVPAWCTFATTLTRLGVSHFYIHFNILNLTRPLTESWFAHPVVVSNSECVTAVELARDTLRVGKSSARLCLAKAAVYACLATAVDRLDPTAQAGWADFVEGSYPLAGAMRFIEDHLAESISVSDVAAHSRVGRDQFARLFRKAFGQSPHRYIVDRRLASAAELLAFGDERQESIAERCGFTDCAHMSRLFRRRFGLSPGAYRKERSERAALTLRAAALSPRSSRPKEFGQPG